jgi:hypothetical protein
VGGKGPRFAGLRQGFAAGIIVHPANAPSFNCFSPSRDFHPPTPNPPHRRRRGSHELSSAGAIIFHPRRSVFEGARIQSFGQGSNGNTAPRRSARIPATSRATGSIQSTGPLPQTFPANQSEKGPHAGPDPGFRPSCPLRERENGRPAQCHWLLPKPRTIHSTPRRAAATVLSRRIWYIGDLGIGPSLSASAIRRIHAICHATEAEGDRGRNTQQPEQRSTRPA